MDSVDARCSHGLTPLPAAQESILGYGRGCLRTDPSITYLGRSHRLFTTQDTALPEVGFGILLQSSRRTAGAAGQSVFHSHQLSQRQ